MAVIDRWLEKVRCPTDPDECWIWVGAKHGSRAPRGCFWNGAKKVDAARWIYLYKHPFAQMDGKVVMHSCDNNLCVNPTHLSLGTQADNVADAIAKKRSHHFVKPATLRIGGRKTQAFFREHPERRSHGEDHGKASAASRSQSAWLAKCGPSSPNAPENSRERLRSACATLRCKTIAGLGADADP